MTEDEYAEFPEQIEIRLVDVIIEQLGFGSKKYAIVTAPKKQSLLAVMVNKPLPKSLVSRTGHS